MNHSISLPKEIWERIYSEASLSEKSEPILAGYLHETILKYNDLNSALSAHLANKLASASAPASMLNPALNASFSDPKILNKIAHDIQATVDRDSACNLFSTPFLHFKGFLSLQAYRASHSLWAEGKKWKWVSNPELGNQRYTFWAKSEDYLRVAKTIMNAKK